MDILFSELKKKEVIDVCTGKKLGKIFDLAFSFPDGKIISFSAKNGIFSEPTLINLSQIERVGEDAVLVNTSTKDGVCDNPVPPKDEKKSEQGVCREPCKPPKHDVKPRRENFRPPPRELRFDEDE